jgi:hypothetical protein
MAGFETFDLGRVFATAEGIKGMKRQAETDRLRDMYLNTQIAGAEQFQGLQKQQFDQAAEAKQATRNYLAAQAVETADDPIAAARRFAPELIEEIEKQHGPGSFDRLPPEVVKKAAAMGKQEAAIKAGIAPAQPEAFTLSPGQTRFEGGKPVASVKPSPTAGRSFRPLTPEEVAQSGLPPGTSAQVDETTGKVDVLSKRDASSTLNQKDATTAKMKLNTVSLARQQLNNIRQRFGSLKGTMSAGAFGQGSLPTEGGRAFDRSVDQMRSTLTALTRVPGVGAMSDYETKLDQAKFPTRAEYESVTQQQIDDLDNMLNAIEAGYKDLLSGGQTQQQTGPVQIQGDADYARIPSGSQYIAPDGSTRTKR